jgi:uncharacterized membrane protein YadS
LPENLILLVPGFLVSVVVAVAARFLSDHYGAPAMLMALLLGIAFHFLAEEGRCVPGIAVSAKGVLRFGVALLGIRVSVELMASLGFGVICLVAAGVVLTILFGMLGARLLRRGWRFALLTGGAVMSRSPRRTLLPATSSTMISSASGRRAAKPSCL